MSSSTQNSSQQQRQQWMSVLAKAPADKLKSLASSLLENFQFSQIRPAQIGLTQVRGRMGGTGSQFNVGDITITRCVVQLNQQFYGHSYVIGRDKQHALAAAKLDALLQDSQTHELAYCSVVEPLARLLERQRKEKQAASAQTKVDFFTLVRGED